MATVCLALTIAHAMTRVRGVDVVQIVMVGTAALTITRKAIRARAAAMNAVAMVVQTMDKMTVAMALIAGRAVATLIVLTGTITMIQAVAIWSVPNAQTAVAQAEVISSARSVSIGPRIVADRVAETSSAPSERITPDPVEVGQK